MKTYSFKDLSGAFTHPAVGAFLFSGQIGLGQITISMAGEKSSHDVAADGTVLVSFIAGDNGTVTIEVQQTSELHKFLLAWYNAIKLAAMAGESLTWAAAAITIRNLVDGSTHAITGISPSKNPDKTYAAQGGKITWSLMAADIQSSAA